MAIEAVVTPYHVAFGLSRPYAQNLICYVCAIRSSSCWRLSLPYEKQEPKTEEGGGGGRRDPRGTNMGQKS
eukprot:9502301-Pyramimonas_sp.AAC.2